METIFRRTAIEVKTFLQLDDLGSKDQSVVFKKTA